MTTLVELMRRAREDDPESMAPTIEGRDANLAIIDDPVIDRAARRDVAWREYRDRLPTSAPGILMLKTDWMPAPAPGESWWEHMASALGTVKRVPLP